MKLENFVTLGVRLFAIVLAIYSVFNLIQVVSLYYESELGWSFYAYLGMMLSFILLAIYLWFFPVTVTKRLISFEDSGTTDISSATADQLQLVAFTTLGLYLLFNVLSDITYWGVFFMVTSRDHLSTLELSIENKASMFATGVELIFVLFLLLGGKGIVKLIRRLRDSA